MTENHPRADWRDGFLFVGNQPALDFLNTRPFMNGEFVELLVDVPSLLCWFGAAGLLDSRTVDRLKRQWQDDRGAHRTLRAMREFRERLREDILAWEAGDDLRRSTLREIDELLAEHPMRVRMKAGGKLTAELWFPTDVPDDLFAPIAHYAAKLFTEADRSRIRKCGSCILHFLDTSKKGNRQWCSMNLCGNRFKVAAYAARQRAQE